MTATIYLNDMPIEALGLLVYEGEPFLGGFSVSRPDTPWAGRRGSIPAAYGTVAPRVHRFVAATRDTTAAEREARLDDLADLLAGKIEIRYASSPDRVMHGVASVFEASVALSPKWQNIEPRIVVELVSHHNHRYDAQPTSLVLSSARTPIPMGSVPHHGLIYLTGTAAGALSGEVRLRYRGSSGLILGELVLSVSLASGEYAILDLEANTITKVSTSGTTSNVFSWKTGGSFFRLAPRDGTRSLGIWPTLELTAGVGLYFYRRNWT